MDLLYVPQWLKTPPGIAVSCWQLVNDLSSVAACSFVHVHLQPVCTQAAKHNEISLLPYYVAAHVDKPKSPDGWSTLKLCEVALVQMGTRISRGQCCDAVVTKYKERVQRCVAHGSFCLVPWALMGYLTWPECQSLELMPQC